MLENINKIQKKINFKIKGIIHIGAGSGAELRNYCKLDIKNFLMIEPDPLSYKKLVLRKLYYSFFFQKKIKIINCLITDEVKNDHLFNIMNVKDCNSIYNFNLHSKFYPTIYLKKTIKMRSETLNNLFSNANNLKHYNFINIDIQGAELLAFKGASQILNKIKGIYTEINFQELYKNCAMVDEIDNYLKTYGFKRVYTNTDLHPSWGDALYLKN